MRKTNLKGWTEEWAESYRKEEEVLHNIFTDDLIGLFHIGSTSISAIGFAKPIIDMLMVVRDIERVDAYTEKLIALGYNVSKDTIEDLPVVFSKRSLCCFRPGDF